MRIEWNDQRHLPYSTDARSLSPGTGLLVASFISLLMWAMIVGLAIVL